MRTRIIEPGLLDVRYDAVEELEPHNQLEVMALVRSQVARQPTAVIFDLGELTRLSPRVPNFWLEVATELGPNLVAFGVVSTSLVVRALTGAFAMAATLRRLGLQVEVFDEPGVAHAWARRQLPAPWYGALTARPGLRAP